LELSSPYRIRAAALKKVVKEESPTQLKSQKVFSKKIEN